MLKIRVSGSHTTNCGGNITKGKYIDIGNKTIKTENTYPSSSRDHGSSYGSGSESKSSDSQYGLHNLKELPRVANKTEFKATCHGSIVVNSIIDHAITRNSQGYGANALASLKTLNLSHNYLGDSDIKRLNDGLYGYTLILTEF